MQEVNQLLQDEMFKCDIEPRELSYSLLQYHEGLAGDNEFGGELGYTWSDKPHRLVFDLIAAVRYYRELAVSYRNLSIERQ